MIKSRFDNHTAGATKRFGKFIRGDLWLVKDDRLLGLVRFQKGVVQQNPQGPYPDPPRPHRSENSHMTVPDSPKTPPNQYGGVFPTLTPRPRPTPRWTNFPLRPNHRRRLSLNHQF